MDFNSGSGGQHNICIKVNKVYDWVTRQVDVPLITFDDDDLENGNLEFDCHYHCYDYGVGDGPAGDVQNQSQVEDPCKFLGGKNFTVECFPSDVNGLIVNPFEHDAIVCTEIIQPEGRQSVEFHLPDGTKVVLQKVKVVKTGFIVVQVKNSHGKTCTSKAIPWSVSEKFFLCAPEGTYLDCEITDFECDANLVCKKAYNGKEHYFELQQLDISINLCQNVQMEAWVKLEVSADFCQPRADMQLICPPLAFPPQCESVFPGPNSAQ